jgi:D-sedoheptulose 7-phosphate isomerase
MSGTAVRSLTQEYLERLGGLVEKLPVERIEAIGDILFDAYVHGKHLFVAGNGGSAATASHMALDLGKCTTGASRGRLRITSLNDNAPLLTALANDRGYEHVFSGQLLDLVDSGDVLLVLSCSGRSPNIVEAMRYARSRSATVVALLGFDGGEAVELADEFVVVPADDFGLVEDVHMILDHVLAAYLRQRIERGELAPS